MHVAAAADVVEILNEMGGKSIEQQLAFLSERFWGSVVFSSSLGQEDQVITDMIAKNGIATKIFTIDTGRLFPELYELIDRTNIRYKIKMAVYFPDHVSVEALVNEKGPNSFYESVENRIECCNIRKVKPLNRALDAASVWVTGLRREQSANREGMQLLEWLEERQLFKFNPLIDWSYQDVLSYIKKNDVPCNPLHHQGFISIGCAPCTRAVAAAEDPRSGRWWWESSKKECGLHK